MLGTVRGAARCLSRGRAGFRAPRIGVEAGVGFGWERWLGDSGAFVGMDGFGASAPAAKLYEHFGITPAKVAEAAKKLVKR